MQAVEQEYVSYDQAAHFCGVSRWTIHRAVKAGQLTASGSGRLTRFAATELRRWMRERD